MRQSDGTLWYGRPTLFGESSTKGGSKLDFALMKWYSLPFTGVDRDVLPVSSEFPCLQWAVVDQMGTRSYGNGGPWQPQSFSVVPIESIVHVAPIVQIGTLPQMIGKDTLKRGKQALANRPERRISRHHWPWEQIRPGPLFTLVTPAYGLAA